MPLAFDLSLSQTLFAVEEMELGILGFEKHTMCFG